MRLVNHQESGGRRQSGQDRIAEVGVVESLRRDQQHINGARVDRRLDLVPFIPVGRVDGASVDAGASRRLDLVAHQCQQWGDDHRRAGSGARHPARRTQQRGGDEIHRRLAPTGALDAQHPPVVDHQRFDRQPLVIAQPGALTGEPPQDSLGLLPYARPLTRSLLPYARPLSLRHTYPHEPCLSERCDTGRCAPLAASRLAGPPQMPARTICVDTGGYGPASQHHPPPYAPYSPREKPQTVCRCGSGLAATALCSAHLYAARSPRPALPISAQSKALCR